MKTVSELTNDFLKHFQDLGAFLKITKGVNLKVFKTFPPVTQKEIEKVEQKLKTKLDDVFLAYFKESNGYELQYDFDSQNPEIDEGQNERGAIRIPGLKEIFKNHMDPCVDAGDYEIETLGGRDVYETNINMYCFDRYDEWRDESRYYAVYYFVTDNVLLLSDDYDACIEDSHPITVSSYFELCLATAGLVSRRYMLERLCDGNYKIIDFTAKTYEVLYPWSKTIEYAKADSVTPEFYKLAILATDKKGRQLESMKQKLKKNKNI